MDVESDMRHLIFVTAEKMKVLVAQELVQFGDDSKTVRFHHRNNKSLQDKYLAVVQSAMPAKWLRVAIYSPHLHLRYWTLSVFRSC